MSGRAQTMRAVLDVIGRDQVEISLRAQGNRYTAPMADLAILYEHPEWQKPLFKALDDKGVDYTTIDLKRAAYCGADDVPARVVFNQASPSAYIRGRERAIPLAMSLIGHLENMGCDVVNGSRAFALELSKAAQIAMLRRIDVDHPRSIIFNDVQAAVDTVGAQAFSWPLLLKPDLGGSGARIAVVDDEQMLAQSFRDPNIWRPDNLFLLQELLPHDPDHGIVRLEMMGGKLLYAMRVVTHGRFNLCPSPVCNADPDAPSNGATGDETEDGQSACEIIPASEVKPVEFYPYPEVPPAAVRIAERVMAAANIDIGAVEYLQTDDGRMVFYDVNANSNLRASVAETFGFDPFERVAQFLVERIESQKMSG